MKRIIMTCLAVVTLFFGCQVAHEDNTAVKAEFLAENGLKLDQVLDVTENQGMSRGFHRLEIVKLSGFVNHFGMDITTQPPQFFDWFASVPDVKVWIAEYPFTRFLPIKSDETGWWHIYVLKFKGQHLYFSFIYEKEGWITTKSNVIEVVDEDNLDLAIQFIDPLYYNYAVKPMVEEMLYYLTGQPTPLENAIVTTIGKSWASMHHPQVHGVVGVHALLTPLNSGYPAFGPIYFNDYAQPDPFQTSTSQDGGVVWINAPTGSYSITGTGGGFTYTTVEFDLSPRDIDNGVILYIATPPDCVISSDDSGYIPGGN